MSDPEGALYRGLTADMVREVGKVTVSGTALEDIVYRVAEALGLEPRRWQATKTVHQIREAMRDRGVPPWARASSEEVDSWLSDVLNALDRRGAIVHRMYFSRAMDGGMVQHGQRTNRVEDARPVSAEQMIATTAELDRVSAAGGDLLQRLLPKLADGVYEFYYGPDSGIMIVTRVDGEWPKRPTPDDRARWYRQLNRQFPGYFPPPTGYEGDAGESDGEPPVL